jgi:hypothetical protein
VQATLAGLFADVATHTCPHCTCIQPKVKRSGKQLAFMVHPLSPKQMANNASNGVTLHIRSLTREVPQRRDGADAAPANGTEAGDDELAGARH